MTKIQTLTKILILSIFAITNFQTLGSEYGFTSRRILSDIKRLERNNKRVSLIGTIISPEEASCSHIYISYNGKLVKVRNSNYSLFTIKDFDSNNLGLLFVSPENITFNSEDNTISFLKLFSDKNHKFFMLRKKIQYDYAEGTETLTWDINESKLTGRQEIPLNTVIIFISPNSIEFELENVNWKKNNNLIELPRIVIESIVDEVKFEKSCLAFMNIKCLHREQDRKEIIKDNIKLSMLL